MATQTTGFVRVPLETTLAPGDTATVDLWYAGSQSRRGVYGYENTEIDTVDLPGFGIAFTFAEPLDAEFIYPCNNQPHDKALFTVHVRVPTGYTVVSNGVRVDSTVAPEESNWQTWHHPVPMPTYLFCVNASVYTLLQQEATSMNGGTIPIYNYVWPQYYDGEEFSAVKALKRVPEMFTALEKFFGEYPFKTYGHVVVKPISFGAMEHQTMVTTNRKWLDGKAEAGLAHEMGHHWSGNLVTCGTWADIWLNEGGATWSEALWRLHSEDPRGYADQMARRRFRYLQTAFDDPPVYDPTIGLLFNEGTTYCKAGWIYHMMYQQEGDAFVDALRKWYAQPQPVARQTAEFIEFLKQEIPNPKIEWDIFFDQWLLQRYHPVVVATATANSTPNDSGYYRVQIELEQVQDLFGFTTLFQFPLTVTLHGDGISSDVKVTFTGQKKMTVVREERFPVDGVELNADRSVLMEDSVLVITSVSENAQHPAITVGGNPRLIGQPLVVSVANAQRMRVYGADGALFEVREMDGQQVVFDTRTWPSGLIMLVAEGGSGFVRQPLVMIR
jgi:aminopeptidase N